MKSTIRICVVGLGQIGGSLAWAIKREGHFVYGISRRRETIDYAIKNGIVDSGDTSIANLNRYVFDVVFLAVHLGLYKEYVRVFRGFQGILSDVGSVKRIFYNLAKRNVERFVGCHPIAGTEMSGIEHADPDIFREKYCIISGWSDKVSRDIIADLWRSIGANVVFMSAHKHDRFVSAVSHLPHVVSFSLVNATYHIRRSCPQIFGGSYKDITRVARSSEEMWSDIFVFNSDYVVQQIQKQIKEMKKLMLMIKSKQKSRILKYISKTKSRV